MDSFPTKRRIFHLGKAEANAKQSSASSVTANIHMLLLDSIGGLIVGLSSFKVEGNAACFNQQKWPDRMLSLSVQTLRSERQADRTSFNNWSL